MGLAVKAQQNRATKRHKRHKKQAGNNSERGSSLKKNCFVPYVLFCGKCLLCGGRPTEAVKIESDSVKSLDSQLKQVLLEVTL